MSALLTKIEEEAHRLEWNLIYTSKGHYNAAMLWNAVHYILGIGAVLFGAFAGKGFAEMNPWLATVLASVSAALTAVITFLKPSEKATPHHKTGTQLSSLLNRLRFYQKITVNEDRSLEELSAELKQISEDYNSLTENALPVPWVAYQITRRGIRRGEHRYDEEDEK